MKGDHKDHYITMVERGNITKEITGLDEDGVPIVGDIENIDYDYNDKRIFCETCQEYLTNKDVGASPNWELWA